MAGYNSKRRERVTRFKAATLTVFIYAGLVGGLFYLNDSNASEFPTKIKEWINNAIDGNKDTKPSEQA